MWSQKGREDITNQSIVREKLLDFFNETNMTKYKFAKRSGLSNNTTKVRDIRSYMLTTLYNAPVTCSNYYKAEVNHDFYGK